MIVMNTDELRAQLLQAADEIDSFVKEASISTARKTVAMAKVAGQQKEAMQKEASFEIGSIGEKQDFSGNPLQDFLLS